MDHVKLIDLMASITKRRSEMLHYFFQNVKKTSVQDRGIEGWFQTELMSELEKSGTTVEHLGNKPDLKFPDGEFVELKMTTSFNPTWIIDGMIGHEAPVLFFSGCLKNLPDYEEEDKVMIGFTKYIKDKRKNDIENIFGQSGVNIQYRTVDLKEGACIVGFLESSDVNKCEKV